MIQKPLVTLILLGYNQEDLIAAAVEGAFSQTYEPLQIILSDDSSTDGTFEIMCKMARAYKGSARVVVTRNERNLGICRHVNRIMNLAEGELVVASAGDDISLPNRVEKTVETWDASGRLADYLFFNVLPLGNGVLWYQPELKANSLHEQIVNGGARIKGATAAWTRRLFAFWGPLPEECLAEDKVLPFRAALCGGLVCEDVPVIRYRLGEVPARIGGRERLEQDVWRMKRVLRYYQIFTDDFRHLEELDRPTWLRVTPERSLLAQRRAQLARELGLLYGGRLSSLRLLASIVSKGTWERMGTRGRLNYFLRVLRHKVIGGAMLGRLDVAEHHADRIQTGQ